MNCLPNVSIALALLSLCAGMLLLYKTQKENLNAFFKVVSWFVIVVSFSLIVCCGMQCMMHGCMMKQNCGGMQQCGPNMGMGGCAMGGHGGMMRHGNPHMMMHGGMNMCDMPCCNGMQEKKCDMGEEDCCMRKGEKRIIIEKDTVITKK